jgi:hypothetical protein
MVFEFRLSGLDSKLRQAGVSSYLKGIARQAAQMIDNLVGREEEEKILQA